MLLLQDMMYMLMKIKNMEQYVDKVKKEIEEKEKEDQKKKLDLLQEFKKKERAKEQKR